MIRVLKKSKNIETEKKNNISSEQNMQTIINMMKNAMKILST